MLNQHARIVYAVEYTTCTVSKARTAEEIETTEVLSGRYCQQEIKKKISQNVQIVEIKQLRPAPKETKHFNGRSLQAQIGNIFLI